MGCGFVSFHLCLGASIYWLVGWSVDLLVVVGCCWVVFVLFVLFFTCCIVRLLVWRLLSMTAWLIGSLDFLGAALAALVVTGGHLAVAGLGVGWLLCLLLAVGLESLFPVAFAPNSCEICEQSDRRTQDISSCPTDSALNSE